MGPRWGPEPKLKPKKMALGREKRGTVPIEEKRGTSRPRNGPITPKL